MNFLDIPAEIVVCNIAQHLDEHSVRNLRSTCKILSEVVAPPKLQAIVANVHVYDDAFSFARVILGVCEQFTDEDRIVFQKKLTYDIGQYISEKYSADPTNNILHRVPERYEIGAIPYMDLFRCTRKLSSKLPGNFCEQTYFLFDFMKFKEGGGTCCKEFNMDMYQKFLNLRLKTIKDSPKRYIYSPKREDWNNNRGLRYDHVNLKLHPPGKGWIIEEKEFKRTQEHIALKFMTAQEEKDYWANLESDTDEE